ncbi:hypothetical protein ID866_8099 [Astraeus odoratus]|nr:hypothetical protein ID866_8099 [Astraeus odoratus]
MDSRKLCEFLVQCELNFHDRPQAFCLDVQKVRFFLSFLKGIALTWFKPDLLNTIPGTEPAWADDYSKFVTEFMMNFGPHNPVGDAEHQLDNLLMKDSSQINQSIIEFNCIATQQPSGGSSSKQSNNSSSTNSLSSTGKGKNPQHLSSSTPKSSDSSMPDLSGIIGKDGKLTPVEHLHHMKHLLCPFCGLPGHLAKDCPRSTSHAAKAHTAQAAPVAASTAEKPAKATK